MMRQGFLNIVMVVVIAILGAGLSGYFYVFQNRTSLKKEVSPKNTEDVASRHMIEAPQIPREDIYNKKPESDSAKKKVMPMQSQQIQSIQIPNQQHTDPVPMKAPQTQMSVSQNQPVEDIDQQFAVLDNELVVAKASGSFLSLTHANRILSDITMLENRRYPKSETERLRTTVFGLSPELQDQAKQKQGTPSAYVSAATLNCQSNSAPVFTNDITDMNTVNYIGPPPTMGAGPSLKTHSYIGTDHARVPVYAPAAMILESGSHYVGGPYMMEFLVSCEVKVRFGHITEPVEAIKKLLPTEPKEDSRTQELAPIFFAAGELVGYTTGTSVAGNWDFGVYNSTVRNRYTDDPQWGNSTTYTTAVCPFDYFSASLKPRYFSKFNSAALGGNPPHGEPFCKGI